MVVEPKPPYLGVCVWCEKEILEEEEDQVCPANSGDKHVPQMFGREMFDKKETTNEH